MTEKIKTFGFFFAILFSALCALVAGFVACGWIWGQFGAMWGAITCIAYVSAIFSVMGAVESG